MAAVMTGVDPHKATHTAVAISAAEEPLGELQARACAAQAERLLAWAAAWPQRTWAVEGAGGLGHLLAQQLVAAGERVLDVPPKLAARVRLLASGNVNKNDPNDARSVAVAALRPGACPSVRAEDHTAVLKVWAKRHRDLSRARNQVVCRLHAVLCDLVPGGVSKRITASQAVKVLDEVQPCGAAGAARWILAEQFLTDLRRIDTQRSDVKKKLAAAVRASGTTVTEIFGVGPAVAAAVLGDTGDIARFPSSDHFAAYNGTAPVEVSSGGRVVWRLSLRGNRRMNHAVHMAAVTQVRHSSSKGRAYYDKKIAEGKTPKEALRALKRQVSDALYRRMKADARRAAGLTGPGGQPGSDSVASAAGLHPEHRLFGQATPGPDPTLRPPFQGHASCQAGQEASDRAHACIAPGPYPGVRLRGAQGRGPWPARFSGAQELRRRSRHLLPSRRSRKLPRPLDTANKEQSICTVADV
jgi:transposase